MANQLWRILTPTGFCKGPLTHTFYMLWHIPLYFFLFHIVLVHCYLLFFLVPSPLGSATVQVPTSGARGLYINILHGDNLWQPKPVISTCNNTSSTGMNHVAVGPPQPDYVQYHIIYWEELASLPWEVSLWLQDDLCSTTHQLERSCINWLGEALLWLLDHFCPATCCYSSFLEEPASTDQASRCCSCISPLPSLSACYA